MSRPLRLQFPGALYHVISRGNRQEKIFSSDRDRREFLKKANETFVKFCFQCFAYCLMDNHYHIFVRTLRANLSQGMHQLNSSYANWFMKKHAISGVLFQSRFKSILVDEDAYAVELSAYIHLNPVRAGITAGPEAYPWSSYLDYFGERRTPLQRIDTSLILGYFGTHPEQARLEYSKYILDRLNIRNPALNCRNRRVLGSPEYIMMIRNMVKTIGQKREIPETKSGQERSLNCQEILDLLSSFFNVKQAEILERRKNNIYRQLFIRIATKHTASSLGELGLFLGMDYSAVSIAARRFEKKMKRDSNLCVLYRQAESDIEKACAGQKLATRLGICQMLRPDPPG